MLFVIKRSITKSVQRSLACRRRPIRDARLGSEADRYDEGEVLQCTREKTMVVLRSNTESVGKVLDGSHDRNATQGVRCFRMIIF